MRGQANKKLILIVICIMLGYGITTHKLLAEDACDMYVAVRNINLHTQPNNESDSKLIPYREKVTVLERGGNTGWVTIRYQGEKYYFYEPEGEEYVKEKLPEPSFEGNTVYQKKALTIAKDIFENWDTAYGHQASDGKPSADGKYYFDCSGFVSYIMNGAMKDTVPLYNISANIETLGETTSIYNKGLTGEFKAQTICEKDYREELLQPGDVLFFDIASEGATDKREYNHCGVYLGNGEMIHSSHSFDGSVRLMLIDEFYQEKFVKARRYLPEKVVAANKKHWAAASTTIVYKNSGKDGEVLTKISLMQSVTLLYTDNGNWSYVKLSNGKKGYILTKNLCSNLAGKGISCRVRNSGLKLYKKTSTKSDYITVKAGSKVSLRGNKGKFYKVKYKEKWYYIYAPKKIADKLTTY